MVRTPMPRWFGPRARTAALVAWLAYTALAYALVGPRIDHHATEREQAAAFSAAIHREVAAQPVGKLVYIRNRVFPPLLPYWTPHEEFPGWAAAFSIFFPTDWVDGREVRFVEPNRAVIASSRRGPRTRALLVAPPSP